MFRLTGEQWTFRPRPSQDRTGDRTTGDPYPIAGCVFWIESETDNDERRDTITRLGYLAIPLAGTQPAHLADQPTSPEGDVYDIVGKARWNKASPITGWSTGYTVYRIKGVF